MKNYINCVISNEGREYILNKSLKMSIVLSYISMFAGIIISIIYTPFMLKNLGQQQYGLYNMAASAISYLNLFDLGLGNAVVRYSTKYRMEGREKEVRYLYGMFFQLFIVISVIIIIVGFILIFNVSNFFTVSTGAIGQYQLQIIMVVMVASLAISFPGSVYGSIITSYEEFTFLKITGLVSTILNPIIMIPLLLNGYKAISMSIVALILNILLISFNCVYVHKVLKIKIKFGKIDFNLLKEISCYSGFIFLGAVVDQLYWNTDKIILGMVSGENTVAVYSLGSQIHSYYQQFSWSISNVFFPRVTKMVTENNFETINIFFKKIGRIQYFLLFLILSGFFIFGKEFIRWWGGSNYIDAYYIALLVISAATVPLIQNMGVHIIQAMNKHAFRSICYIFIAIFNAISSYLLADKLGGIGCAICTAVSLLLGHGLLMNYYYKFKIGLDIKQFWKEILKISIVFIPLIALSVVINSLFITTSFAFLVFKILLYAFIYIIIAYTIAMNNDEKSMINSFINKLRRKT